MEPTVTLSNGVIMPRVGLGTWQLSDADKCSAAVRICLETEYQLIDTASVYRNETFIGEVLDQFEGYKTNPLETANGKGVFVTTKAGPSEMGYEKVLKACEDSLGRLRQTSLDLYLLHWPGASSMSPASNELRKIRLESWRAMEKLLADGKCRAIGVCNFLPRHLEQLIEDGIDVIPMVNQLELHPLCPNWELQKTAKKLGIVVQAYSSLGTGSSMLLEHPVVTEVAEMEMSTNADVLLRWAVQQGITVIPRSTSAAHLKSNLAVTEWELSEAAMAKLNAICPLGNEEVHFCWDPNTIA